MKKLLPLTLALALAIPSALPARAASFPDVKESDWFYSYVNDLSDTGVVNGYPDGTFGPENLVRWDEALKLILLAAGESAQAPTGDGWASGYLTLAEERGYLAPGYYDLTQPISRQDVCILASRALRLGMPQGTVTFPDCGDPEILALAEAGIVQGIQQGDTLMFCGEQSLHRHEISAIIWRMQQYAGNPVTPPDSGDNNNNNGSNPGGDTPAGPGTTGKIPYRDQYLDALEGVPVFSHDPTSFYLSDGRMYTTDPDLTLLQGIDVSSHQGIVDWELVREDGIDFAMLRVGYRGYSVGSLNKDPNFTMNIENAQRAGLPVGVYFFSQAITVEEAREEAAFVLEALSGYDIQMPVVFDWEVIGTSKARTDGLSTATLGACAQAFCQMVEDAGYQPMIYFNVDTGYKNYDLRDIVRWPFWLAQYKEQPTFYYDFALWQYTSKGRVNGIQGNVDMDVYFVQR